MNKPLENGIKYEIYTKNIISNKYLNCWLWKEVPNQILIDLEFNEKSDDIGCDIVCQNHDLSFVFIQCKNYSTTGINNTINISNLSGFYNFIAETGFNGIVYYSGKLSAQIIYRKRKIQYINLPFIKIEETINFIPKEYQIEAYNKLLYSNRALLSMPCGTGKTFVSFMLSLNYQSIIILTPLISTTEQIYTHYKNYYSKYNNINYILINSKANRNIKKIDLSDNNIICSTYDSCDIINKLLKKIEHKILIIIDECHNLTQNNNEINVLLKNHNDILFISATPKENITFNDKYELKWKDAISNRYITDYNFYYPNNDKIIEHIDNLQFDKSLIDKTILINKAYFLLESIKLTNIKKCIVYLKSISESEQFTKIIQTLNIYFNFNIKINEINYHTTANNRKKYLTKFVNNNSTINIIANVHILDEGIDIPECDSVYLTNPNNNPINIIQRISRANRLDKNNNDKIAKIFIWAKNKNKLEQIIDRLKQTIDIKYGIENNKFVGKHVINNIDNYTNIDTFFTKFKISATNLNITLDNIDYVLDNSCNLWFKFITISNLLDYKNRKDALRDLISKDNKKRLKDIKTLNKLKEHPNTIYINESGLYNFLIRSRMKKAINFQLWLSNDVLPKLRKKLNIN
jgi:superfamily II DNA or RNA helicase